MIASDCTELHFLLDRAGAVIVFEEKDTAWAGVLAFSTESLAREFCRASNLDVAEIASIATANRESIAALLRELKQRAVRYLLFDLDYRTGRCVQVDFEGDSLGASRERRFTPRENR